MKMFKNSIAALAVASTAILPIMTSSASAHDRGYQHRHGGITKTYCHRNDRNCDGRFDRNERRGDKKRHGISGNDAAGIAILGAVGGLIIGSVIANQNNQPNYVRPRSAPQPSYGHNDFPPAPRHSQPNVVTYSGSMEPWSRGWYNYCENRYRSFNPQKGTYRGYDGQDHFCVAK